MREAFTEGRRQPQCGKQARLSYCGNMEAGEARRGRDSLAPAGPVLQEAGSMVYCSSVFRVLLQLQACTELLLLE